MKKQEKIELVEGLKKELGGSALLLAMDFQGLKVEEINEVRRRIRASGGYFRVIKNSLIERALAEVGIKGWEELLIGPTALSWHQGDMVSFSKILVELTKRYEALKLKGGMIEGKKVSGKELMELSTMPSKQELLARLAQDLAGGQVKFLWLLKSLQSKLAQMLNGLKEKKVS